MLKLAVFVSGRGSNLRAILDAIESGYLKAEVKAVFSDKAECGAIDLARSKGIPTCSLSSVNKDGYCLYEELPAILRASEAELLVLAGFLKKIPDEVCDCFENRIINIHPALLPSFGGKGMYGMNVHRAVFESSAKVTGATVHFVDKIYDNGKIIAQSMVDISDAASPEEIAKRVLETEHKLLPYVIKMISEDRVKLVDGRVMLIKE